MSGYVGFTNDTMTIEHFYKETERMKYDREEWRPLKDNCKYEVSASAKIRKVGNTYPLASHATGRQIIKEKRYTDKMIVTRSSERLVRVFKDGRPVKVDPKIERANAFNTKVVRDYK